MDANGFDRLRPPDWGAHCCGQHLRAGFNLGCSHPRFPVDVEASFAAVAGKTPIHLLQGAGAPAGYETRIGDAKVTPAGFRGQVVDVRILSTLLRGCYVIKKVKGVYHEQRSTTAAGLVSRSLARQSA